jgi:hypothetical protein
MRRVYRRAACQRPRSDLAVLPERAHRKKLAGCTRGHQSLRVGRTGMARCGNWWSTVAALHTPRKAPSPVATTTCCPPYRSLMVMQLDSAAARPCSESISACTTRLYSRWSTTDACSTAGSFISTVLATAQRNAPHGPRRDKRCSKPHREVGRGSGNAQRTAAPRHATRAGARRQKAQRSKESRHKHAHQTTGAGHCASLEDMGLRGR